MMTWPGCLLIWHTDGPRVVLVLGSSPSCLSIPLYWLLCVSLLCHALLSSGSGSLPYWQTPAHS